MTQFDVVGLGASVVDILQRIDHLPAKEQVQRSDEIAVQGGGPVATAMVTLARLGARVAMLDVVGDDHWGDYILQGFEQEGVSVAHVQRATGCESSLAVVLVTRDGARTIVFHPGTTPDLAPADVPSALVASARYLHINDRHRQACLYAVDRAKEAGVRVSFDGGAHAYSPETRQLVPLTDVCIVARDFAVQYTGLEDLQAAAGCLLEEGPDIVAVTDGVQGSWVVSRDVPLFHQPAYQMPSVVDTTGCGDSYHGAFLFGLLQEMDLRETAAFASAVAALNTQRLGGRAGLPTLEQVESFLSRV
jgi:sulfofructose kinase